MEFGYYQVTMLVMGCTALFVLWAVPIKLWRNGRLVIYSPLFVQAFGYTLFFVVPGCYIAFFPYLDRGWGYSRHFHYAMGLLIIGYPFTLWGYFSRVSRNAVSFVKRYVPRIGDGIIPEVSPSKAFLLYLATWIPRLVLVITGSYLHSYRSDFQFTSPHYSAIEFFARFSAVFYVVTLLRATENRNDRSGLAYLGVLLLELVWALPSGRRQPLLLVAIYTLLTLLITVKRIPIKRVISFAIFSGVFISFAPVYRDTMNRISHDLGIARGETNNAILYEAFEEARTKWLRERSNAVKGTLDDIFDSLGQIRSTAAVVMSTPEESDYQYGKTLFGAFFFFVPRSIWVDKPPVVVPSPFFPGSKGSYPLTLIGSLYWDFSFAGVIVGLFFMGILLRVVYEYLCSERNPLAIGAYVYLSGEYMWIALSFGNIIVTTLRLLFFLLLFSRLFPRRILYSQRQFSS